LKWGIHGLDPINPKAGVFVNTIVGKHLLKRDANDKVDKSKADLQMSEHNCNQLLMKRHINFPVCYGVERSSGFSDSQTTA